MISYKNLQIFIFIYFCLFLSLTAENYDAHYPIYYIRKPLVSCFFSTGDVDSFVKLLWKMAVGADWFSKNSDKMKDEDHSIGSRDYREYTDQILMDIVRDMARRNDFSKLKEIIEVYHLFSFFFFYCLSVSFLFAKAMYTLFHDCIILNTYSNYVNMELVSASGVLKQ